MPRACYARSASEHKSGPHGIERVEYEDGGRHHTNAVDAWRRFMDGPPPNRIAAEIVDEDDDYEAVEVFIPRGLLQRAEALADERGSNIGDVICDTLALGFVAGRGVR